MHTLFGSQGSGSAAVEVALGLAGLPYRTVRAATWEDDSDREALRALNPLGQIPTLQMPDGTVLTESAAILVHLGLEHPESGLLPATSAARAQALRGLAFIAANCYAAIGIIDYPERWCDAPDEAMTRRLRTGARRRLHLYWTQFADQFPAGPYLSGPALGALDVLAATVSRWSGARAHLAAERPAFAELLARVDAHPAVAPVFARHWPA